MFRVDFAAGDFNRPETLSDILENNLCKWERMYNIVNERKTPEVRFSNILEAAEEQTGHKAVVLVDEYDKRKVHKIGVNISSETGTVDGWLVVD